MTSEEHRRKHREWQARWRATEKGQATERRYARSAAARARYERYNNSAKGMIRLVRGRAKERRGHAEED